MKTLVTGAAGFIGSHVVDALRDAGVDVIGLDSLDPGVHRGLPDYLRPDVDYCFADLRHWRPDARMDDVEVVIHLAALGGVARASREPVNVIDANCVGTVRLIDAVRACRRLRRIVHVSSFSVYGGNCPYACATCRQPVSPERRSDDLERGHYEVRCRRCGADASVVPIDERVVPAPGEAYAASKYMQELCFRGFSAAPVTVLRLSSAYGPRLRLHDGEATIIARLAGWIRAGQRPQLFEDGRQLRDWVYVGDVVAGILALVRGVDAPPLINVCSGVGTRLVEASDLIAGACGVSITPQILGGYRPGDLRHCVGDPARLSALIGREPLSFADGALRTFGAPQPVRQ